MVITDNRGSPVLVLNVADASLFCRKGCSLFLQAPSIIKEDRSSVCSGFFMVVKVGLKMIGYSNLPLRKVTLLHKIRTTVDCQVFTIWDQCIEIVVQWINSVI